MGDADPTSPHLLIVEDEQTQRELIASILRSRGFQVTTAGSGEEALAVASQSIPDLILTDWKMPGMSGGDLLREVAARGIPCALVVMTAYGSIAHAVEAMQAGASDYLAKPFERETLLLTIERALRARRLEDENRRLREAVLADRYGEIRGRATAMQRLYQTLDKVAPTEATVLISGESGTGKELVARTLHDRSRRARGTFVAVNCAAIPETLMESELFGYERGAFTGADRRRDGRLAEARGGTLFLDEIASLPLPLQGVLLRALQERRFTRVGGAGEVAVDARFIAASNRDLGAMVAEGSFRDDLFYRLNVVHLQIPPLRQRREDIPLLARALLDRACERHGVTVSGLPPAILRRFMEHPWPGNVRELANVVERLVLLAEEGTIREDDLPPEMHAPGPTAGCPFQLPPSGIVWEEVEVSLMEQALVMSNGNRSAAAKLLGMSYKTFLYRLAGRRGRAQ